VNGAPRPEIRASFERDGSIRVVTRQVPSEVRVWQATNPKARNFRVDEIGLAYTSTVLQPSGPNTWIAHVGRPPAGWTAFFVEMTFPTGGKYPLKLTSGVRVLPDTLPFPKPKPGKTPPTREPFE
jgi:PhoPQ-activated pathogenicity-related protein